MKKRIGNTLKKVFACCALAFLLFSISVPCFASTGVYPNQENTFPSFRSINPSNGWNYDNCVAIADIVEKAYNLNYFSAGVPIAICSGFGGRVWVLVAPSVVSVGQETPIVGSSYNGPLPPLVNDNRAYVYGSIEEDPMFSNGVYITAKNRVSGITYSTLTYLLNTDNTFSVSACVPMLSQYNANDPSASKYILGFGMINSWYSIKAEVLAVRFGDNDWRIPYADEYGDIDPVISELDEWYNNQYASPIIENNFTYELDVPSIITSIPNGAKQIINNVFGFELFGINIAGLLSVLLIVAIVGFIMKKLIK